MSNLIPSARADATQIDPASINKHSESVVQKKARLGLWVAMFLILLIAGTVTVLFYQHQLLTQVQSSLNAQIATNETQQKLHSDKLNNALSLQNKRLQNDLTELTQRIDNTSTKLLALSHASHDDWKLYEVDYLLRMANQRILMEHEATNSLALAASANLLLAELQNADLFAARKKLTEEIEALKLATKVDREGIYLQLLALTQQVEILPLIEPLFEEDEEMVAALDQGEEIPAQTFWQRLNNMGKRVWHKLSLYVRVRDHGRRVDAILPPEDQMYLKQNLRLMLEQAQIGLLREEQHVYQASLDKAQTWIRDYYPLNDQAQIVLNDLEQLKKNNVQQPLPDFSGSAALVKGYIRQKDRLAFSRQGGN